MLPGGVEDRLLFGNSGSLGLPTGRTGHPSGEVGLNHHDLRPSVGNVAANHNAGADDGIRAVGLVHDFLKLVVGNDGQPVDVGDPGALSIRKA